MKFLKRHAYALLFTLFLMGANVYSLLKVFVIPSAVSTVSANTTSSTTASSTASTSTGKVTKTDTTYKDDNMDIKITTGKTSDTTYYVADIQLSSADYLKTALAQNTTLLQVLPSKTMQSLPSMVTIMELTSRAM